MHSPMLALRLILGGRFVRERSLSPGFPAFCRLVPSAA